MTTGWQPYYDVVRRIPLGRVTTYGTIAELAGRPRSARQVGYALAALRGGREKDRDVPWHRVLGKRGDRFAAVSLPPSGPMAPGARQRQLLEAEGVAFDAQDRISLDAYGWFG